MEYNFYPEKEVENLIQYIRNYFSQNGPTAKAVLGVSGGKDSTFVAGILCEAIGADRVVGLLMPNVVQDDMNDSIEVCQALKINYKIVNIGHTISSVYDTIDLADFNFREPNNCVRTNLPARIRMSVLYAFANQYGWRVACTDNLSEFYVGYSTRYGDDSGDFAPIRFYTATEIVAMGLVLSSLPKHLMTKAPHDGMCGIPDEQRFGFTYPQLDTYIRTGECSDEKVRTNIQGWAQRASYKRKGMNQHLTDLPIAVKLF